MNKELGKRLSQLVEEKGLVKSDLAQDIGVSPSALSKYLSGDLEPNAKILANLATALECTVDYLLDKEVQDKDPLIACQKVFMRNREYLNDADKLKLMDIILKNVKKGK